MTEMMKATVLVGPEKIETKLEPVPEMKAGDIRIRVSATGVCGSDIHMWKTGKGWNPNHKGDFWMAHEFCGVVEDPGTSDFEVGDRVVFWANLYCGECDMCRAGQEHLCREVNGTNYTGFVCNGAYAEKFVGSARLAYKLPDTVSDVDAALIDPLLVAYHAVHLSNMKLHDKVLVVGSASSRSSWATLRRPPRPAKWASSTATSTARTRTAAPSTKKSRREALTWSSKRWGANRRLPPPWTQ